MILIFILLMAYANLVLEELQTAMNVFKLVIVFFAYQIFLQLVEIVLLVQEVLRIVMHVEL